MKRVLAKVKALAPTQALALAMVLLCSPLAATADKATAPIAPAPAAGPAPAQTPAVQVLYWSAGDCGPCRLWREGERHAEFKQAADAWGVALVTVRKPSLRDPATAFAWPAAATLHGQAPASFVVPKFLPHFDILCRGKPLPGVPSMGGLGEWDSFWHARLRQAVRSCQASTG